MITDTGCVDEISEKTPEETFEDLDKNGKGPIYTFNEAPDISGISLVKFTAVANGIEKGDMFSVKIDEEYRYNIYNDRNKRCLKVPFIILSSKYS